MLFQDNATATLNMTKNIDGDDEEELDVALQKVAKVPDLVSVEEAAFYLPCNK